MLNIAQVRQLEATYEPEQRHRDRLASTSVVAVVGATAVGKDHLINRTQLPIVGTMTTRQERPVDDPALYTYVSFADMVSRIERRRLVQYTVFGNEIYGSEVGDYELGKANIADVAYQAFNTLTDKGFKEVKSVSVVTSGEQWMSQLRMRTEGMSEESAWERLREAQHSLRWTRARLLGGRATNHLTVVNNPDNVEENLEVIRLFAQGEAVVQQNPDEVRDAIESMEKTLHIFRGSLGSSLLREA